MNSFFVEEKYFNRNEKKTSSIKHKMKEFGDTIDELMMISNNEKRIELYKKIKEVLLGNELDEKANLLKNISGIIAHADLEKKEYDLLLKLHLLVSGGRILITKIQ